MKSSRNTFLIALIVPLLILLLMVIKPLSAYMFGDKIILDTNPVDPTSLLYGDYVIVPLDIANVPIEKLSESLKQDIKNPTHNNALISKKIVVYTELEKNGKIYEAKKVTKHKPEKGIYLKGKISLYMYGLDQMSIPIDYGIDRFYIEENTGQQIEKQAMNGQIKVALKIKNGYGYIDELIIE